MSPVLLRCCALALLLASPLAPAARYTVGPGGAAAGCSHEFLVLALEEARLNPGPDEIRVTSDSGQASGVSLFIDNQELTLRGGFATCGDAAPSGRTVLSGAGGLVAPVVSVRSSNGGAVDVTIEGFDLVEGDNTTGVGGGLRIAAKGRVRIRQCRIANNNAVHGGGIGINGTGLDTTLVDIGDGVRIEDNQAGAFGNGGGIHAEFVRLSLGGVGTVVRRNLATGGGGIALVGDAQTLSTQLDLTSGGEGSDGIVSHNVALSDNGGGLYITGHAIARLYTTDPARPVRLDYNRADDGGGGAIHAGATSAQVLVWDAQFDFNQARFGGAFSLFPTTLLNVDSARAGNAPVGAWPCAATARCNRMIGNRASDFVYGGAVVSLFVDGPQAAATARIASSVLSGNSGTSLFSDTCDDGPCVNPTSIRLSNVLISDHPEAARVFDSANAAAFECDLCTVSTSDPTPPGVGPMFDSNGALVLTRSLLYEPGRDIVGGRTPSLLRAGYLVVHDAADFAADSTVLAADPAFTEPLAGDFSLQPQSPAIDFAPLASPAGFNWSTPAFDVDGNPRLYDDPSTTNVAGPIDLGAQERGDSSFVFRNGFE